MKPILSLLGFTACALALSGANGKIPTVEKPLHALVAAADGSETAEDTRQWVEVTLETPGSLGVEILYQVDVLADVEHLRVNGAMNADDWATIKNIAGLKSLDLSNALSTAVPEKEFDGKSVSYVLLPSNLTSIGNYAFQNSGIQTIQIPATVKSIGDYGFYRCASLKSVDFEEGSQLTTLGERCFRECKALETIAIPDGVATLKAYTFYNCQALADVKLPAKLKTIENDCFYYTSSLELLDFPESLYTIGQQAFQYSGITSAVLPKKMTSLGSYAFQYCTNLTDLVLPAAIHTYSNYQFYNCNSLKSITCPCSTPPAIGDNAFSGFTKSAATLHVPEYAKVNYKLDSFWLGFGNILGDATSEYWHIAGELALTNNRRMEGTPDIDIAGTGCLTVGGNAAMPIRNLILATDIYNYSDASEMKFPQIISNCPAITAESVKGEYRFYANQWYFISFPYDVKVSEITTTNSLAAFAVRYYNGAKRAESGTGASWNDVAADGVLEAGKGYIFMSSKEAYFYFPATDESKAKLFDPNARVMSLEANPSENASNAGWNYVGNPYQSYYDMYYTMLTCPVTVWNPSNRTYSAYSLIDDNLVLRPGQAFFIQASETLQEIEFGTLGRQFTSAVSRSESAAAPAVNPVAGRRIFNLSLSAGELSDGTRVVLNENALLDYESACDAAKFFSDNADVPQLYTIDADGNSLAINERPRHNGSVALAFYAPAPGKFTLTAPRADGSVVLHDALTGSDFALDGGKSYTFEVAEAGHDTSRFSLGFGSSDTTGANGIESSSAVISAEGNVLSVSGAESVEIFTADGRTVLSETLSGETATFTLAAGVYIVKADATAVKCIIK